MKDILTEAEATQQWCPLARAGDTGDTSDKPRIAVNRFGNVPDMDCFCIASKCMAWRLAHKPASSGEETGYCGAFGLPRFT